MKVDNAVLAIQENQDVLPHMDIDVEKNNIPSAISTTAKLDGPFCCHKSYVANAVSSTPA